MDKFYETEGFKKLKKCWDLKLIKTGFIDIARDVGPNFATKQFFDMTTQKSFTEVSMAKCEIILEVYDFENRTPVSAKRNRFVFECYAKGLSLRQIEDEVAKAFPKRLRFKKTQIGRLINSIFNDFDSQVNSIKSSLSAARPYYDLSNKNAFTESYLAKNSLILAILDFESRKTKSAQRDRFILEMRLNGLSLREIEAVLRWTYPKGLRLSKTHIGRFLEKVSKEFDTKANLIKGCAA